MPEAHPGRPDHCEGVFLPRRRRGGVTAGGRTGGRGFASDTRGVTPALGTILILAITVAGIAGIMAWGAPTIDRMKGRNAIAAMVGEFEDLRDAERDLSVPDHSRFPTIAIPEGKIGLEKGTRIMLTVDRDASNPACDFHITDFADTTSKSSVTVSTTGCRSVAASCPPSAGSACLEIHSVTGSSTLLQVTTFAGGVASVTGADFTVGDWLFRLTDGDTLTPTIYAEAWLMSNDLLRWSSQSRSGSREVILDAGAVFSIEGGQTFQLREAVIGDSAFGTGYYGLWLRTLTASSYTEISGAGTHQVYLSLLGNSVRTDATSASRLRFDFHGSLAEAWCNAMLARDANNRLVDATYTADAPCENGGANGVRSVVFTKSSGTACGTGICFQFRFIHARIYAGLTV